jgi:phosphinothricin acetyltransferase
MNPISIRRAERDDLPALAAIYNHYVVHTHVSFDLEPPTLDERGEWLAGFAATGRYQCFVAVKDGTAIGWACSGRFKDRKAYGTSVETSVYLAPDGQGLGLGTRLYETLIGALGGEDVHRLVAVIALPNAASVALHEKLGFRHVGTFSQIGRKFDRFWDVAWYGRKMA